MKFPCNLYYLVMEKSKRPSIISLVNDIMNYITYNENGVQSFKIRNIIDEYKEKRKRIKQTELCLTLDNSFVSSIDDIKELKNRKGFQQLFMLRKDKEELDLIDSNWSDGININLTE